MARATSTLLLICGSLLLVTWLVAPAASAPQSSASRRAPLADLGPLPPELDVVNAQVDRLRARLGSQVTYPVPSRDPFHFAPRARLVPDAAVAAPVENVMPATEVVRPSWPTLVAILTSAEDGTLQAALSDSEENLQFVSPGATVGLFTVVEISPDGVVLTEPVSRQTTRLLMQ